METIIEEQEKEFNEKFGVITEEEKEDLQENHFELDGRAGCDNCLYNVWWREQMKSWHKEKVKQILQALVEREGNKQVIKEKHLCRFNDGDCDCDCYFEAKQDIIQYLQEQIKKL